MTNLEKWVLNEMIKHLQEMEGQVVYGCDLAFKLFENANCTGSYTCNAYESREWIREYWHDLGEVVEDYEDNYGELPVNPFNNEEVFQVQIILHLASNLTNYSDFVEWHWNEEIELTKEVIKTIVSEWSKCL